MHQFILNEYMPEFACILDCKWLQAIDKADYAPMVFLDHRTICTSLNLFDATIFFIPLYGAMRHVMLVTQAYNGYTAVIPATPHTMPHGVAFVIQSLWRGNPDPPPPLSAISENLDCIRVSWKACLVSPDTFRLKSHVIVPESRRLQSLRHG